MRFIRNLGAISVVMACLSLLVYVGKGRAETLPGVPSGTAGGVTKLGNDPLTAEELLKLVPNDRFLGNKNAPVVMIEYASFSCFHCADFAVRVFPRIKEQYVDTGRLLYIFRNFPLDGLSLKAAMLGLCYESNRAFFTYVKAVFSSIEALISTHKDLGLLSNIARISNISDEKFKECTSSDALINRVVQEKFLAMQKLGINATPVFFLNGRKYEGAHNFDSISAEIQKEIALNPNYSARGIDAPVDEH